MRLPVLLGVLLAVAVGALSSLGIIALLSDRIPFVPPAPTPTTVPGQFGLYTPPPASPTATPAPAVSPTPVVVGETTVPVGTQIGQRAPGLRLPNLLGGDVDTTNVEQPMWVYFMATWCPDCREELPMMQRFEHELDGALEVIVVDVDEPGDDVLSFMLSLQVELQVALDEDGSAASAWNVNALPVHFFIDQDGLVYDVIFGGAPREVFVATINELVPDAQLEL